MMAVECLLMTPTRASSPAVVQVHGQGLFAITYVNPADDPQKSQSPK
jgi:hypothetical protein